MRRPKWGVAILVAVLHVVLVFALVRAFTPDFAASVVRSMATAFDVPVARPTPTPTPTLPPAELEPGRSRAEGEARAEGVSGAAGKRARSRPVAAPKARVTVKPTTAPPIAGTGKESIAGAASAGDASGASGAGAGPGSGAAGSGQGAGRDGGGRAVPTVKIAGDISSARDYPHSSRDLRIGASVTIELGVDIRGHVSSCRIVQPSPDPEADRITCRLARKRFVFRPALNRAGNPVPAVYRWRQRWFT